MVRRRLLWTEIAAPAAKARIIYYERGVGHDGHFHRSRADEIDDRGLARDQTSERQCDRVRYAIDTRNANVRAVLIDGDDRFGIRIQFTDFAGINRAVRSLAHFDQTERSARIHHPRIDGQASGLNRLRPCRDADVRAYG